MNAKTLSLMKPEAFLVNTARGAIVDIDALASTLAAGKLAGAGLDVLPKEPIDPNHPILKHPRVILTPASDAERSFRRNGTPRSGPSGKPSAMAWRP